MHKHIGQVITKGIEFSRQVIQGIKQAGRAEEVLGRIIHRGVIDYRGEVVADKGAV